MENNEKLKRHGDGRPRFDRPLIASRILKDPILMDYIEDPYVVVMAGTGFWGPRNDDVIRAMNMMHSRGWDTINIAFMGLRMTALLLNPRANPKYQLRQG